MGQWDTFLMQMLTHNEIFLCEFQRGVIDVTAADYHWEKQTSFFSLFPLFPVKCTLFVKVFYIAVLFANSNAAAFWQKMN